MLFFYRHDFKLLFGTDFQITMSKADRLIYGESCMTHAMAFTAVSIDVTNILKIYVILIFWFDNNIVYILG